MKSEKKKSGLERLAHNKNRRKPWEKRIDLDINAPTPKLIEWDMLRAKYIFEGVKHKQRHRLEEFFSREDVAAKMNKIYAEIWEKLDG